MNAAVPTPEATDPVGRVGRAARVDLYWIPLGAGTPVVEFSGKVFEAGSARRHHRPRCDLYHAMLEVRVPDGRFMIEQAPVPDDDEAARGVAAGGPVGVAWAGRWRVFRYEVRCWKDGIVPDIAAAVDSPVVLSTELAQAERLMATLPGVPRMVWGRDHARTGEMWNSNSVIAWALATSGFDLDTITVPTHGRAPGWQAGLTVASRAQCSRAPDATAPNPSGLRREPSR